MTAVVTEVSVTSSDDSRYYPYPLTGQPLDSVTTAIGMTDRKPWIEKWHGTSSTAWCVDNIEAIARAKAIQGRKAAIDLGKDAAEAQRDLKSDAGVYVHDVLQSLIWWAGSREGEGASIAYPLLPEHLEGARYDLGAGKGEEPPLLADVVEWMVDGFTAFVADFAPKFAATEMPVYNVELGYAGTLDMIIILTGYAISRGTGPKGADEIVASPGSRLVICVDAKTGKAMEGTWKEQVAAYRRATECAPSLGELYPMPQTDCGAVLHLRPDYPDGYSLTLVSSADDDLAWERFLKALSIYRDRQEVKDKPGPAIRPLRADGTMPGPRLCDVYGEGFGRALNPLRTALGAKAELADVARFTAPELLAVKGIGPKLIDAIRQMLGDYGLCLAGEELLPVLGAVMASARSAA